LTLGHGRRNRARCAGLRHAGTGISDYRAHAASIAEEGIYSVAVFHDQVLVPTLRYWKVEELTGLDARSCEARDRLLKHTERVQRIGRRLEEQRLERKDDHTMLETPGAPRARRNGPSAVKVHLVDGTYELFRHYYGAPAHRSAGNEEVGAARAVLGSLLGMLEAGATHMGVATDHVIESWRNDAWPTYKSSAGVPRTCSRSSPVRGGVGFDGPGGLGHD